MSLLDEKLGYNHLSCNELYTDIQSLKHIKYDSKNNPKKINKEVARQFESILMQMVLHSMRDANKAFSSDLLGTEQMDFYQDIFDKQLSLVMSNSGVGFAAMIEKNLEQQNPCVANSELYTSHPDEPAEVRSELIYNPIKTTAPQNFGAIEKNFDETATTKSFPNPEEFVKSVWSYAKNAAPVLGVTPEILIAQAALETNWGKNILQGKNGSSFNLFNIKADTTWNKEVTTVPSLEEKDGIVIKETSAFRCYDSFQESFSDYITFIKNNNRYHDALKKAADPQQYAQALQKAGFATDHNYADKIMKIMASDNFKNMIKKVGWES